MRIKLKNYVVNFGLVIFSLFVSLFLIEIILSLTGFPVESVSHSANVKKVINNIEFSYHFNTNSMGLRYREISVDKSPFSHRVFVLGDSFTEGVGVDEDDRFTNFLENDFSTKSHRTLFLNGGLTGTGPLEYGKIFLKIGLKYELDALLICLYANDVSGTSKYRSSIKRQGVKRLIHSVWPRTYILLRVTRDRYRFKKRTKTSDFIETVSREALRRNIAQKRIDAWATAIPKDLVNAVNRGEFNGSILSNGLLNPSYWTDSIDIETQTSETKWQSMVVILSEIVDESHKHGIEVGIVFIPSRFQYDSHSHEKWNPWLQAGGYVSKDWLQEKTGIQKRLEIWTGEMGLPFFDLTPTFRDAIKTNTDLNWKLDGHWTPAGHAVAGRAIAEWLKRDRVFSFLEQSQ